MSTITVTSQVELDAAIKAHEAQVQALADVIRGFAATNGAYPIAHRDHAANDARAEYIAHNLIAAGWSK